MKMIGVGVRGMGMSKFRFPDWNERKVKRKARTKVVHNRSAQRESSAFDDPLRKKPIPADKTSETSAL